LSYWLLKVGLHPVGDEKIQALSCHLA